MISTRAVGFRALNAVPFADREHVRAPRFGRTMKYNETLGRAGSCSGRPRSGAAG